MKFFKSYLDKSLIIFTLAFAFSCSETDEPIPSSFDALVTFDKLTSTSLEVITVNLDLIGADDILDLLLYENSLYTITYKTEYRGQEITASGLVAFPVVSEDVPMLVFHNGTNAKEADAPSNNVSTFQVLLGSLASAGYIAMLPDYIGFGSSSDIIHPYYNAELTARASTDMLIAVKELALELDQGFNGNVFLSGYSEGGYSTMATHKSMEEEPIGGFDLVASAPSSGGYDVKGMQEYFFGMATYHQPFYLAFVAASYKTSYAFDQPLSDYFQEPYASNILSHFDGSLGGGGINALLTNTISDLVQPDFLANPDDAKFANIIDKFWENSLNDWKPTKRMFMYHGNADITVPYQNSVDTFNDFMNLGVSGDVVSFTTLEGRTHGTGFLPYVVEMVQDFDELK